MHSGAGWELREDLGCGAKRCRRCLGSLGLSGGVMAGISTNFRHSVTNVKEWISGVILDGYLG